MKLVSQKHQMFVLRQMQYLCIGLAKNCAMFLGWVFTLSMSLNVFPVKALAAVTATVPGQLDNDKSRFEEDVVQRLRGRLQQDLSKYCPDGCTLLGIDVDSREIFDNSSANLGFEVSPNAPRNFVANKASVEILVDNRLGKSNIERIQDVVLRSARRYGVPMEVEFTRTTLPDPPSIARAEAEAKTEALDLVKNSIERILNDFCPVDCRLQSVELKTIKIPLEDAQSSLARRAVVIRDSKLALVVSGVTASLTLDSQMDEQRRSQIETIVREHLDVYGQGVLNVRLTSMPRAAKELQKDADDLRADPWGIEKLGRALKVFREFANTKEIIRERDSVSRETEKEREKEKNRESIAERSSATRENNQSRESSQTQTKTDSQKTNNSTGFENFWSQEKVLLIAGLIGLLLLVGALALRFVLTGKQVQHLISEGRTGQPVSEAFGQEVLSESPMPGVLGEGEPASTRSLPVAPVIQTSVRARAVAVPLVGVNDEVAMRMNIQALRDELSQMFISQPKVARDVFARILREDGIEFSAKCVSVLGEILVFDLMGDDDVKKEVTLLAEYIHVNAPIVGDSEQLSLLRSLKLKLTAGKMRQLTQRTRDIFDFLKSYSARQIYDLIADESARSQAVVLTQLPTEKRRAVFELFDGSLKSALLRELCIKESLPREYLYNVAQALKRKLERMGTGDGEMLGGAEVIIDLMERGDRGGQSEMLENLDRTNPELARQVRSRLVSVETLAYLSDGLLLEIFLALEPQVMVTFLAGTRERIRNLILSKAPDEVADDWNESATQIRGLDAEAFKLAEMQVLGKIRSFAAGGMINLNEINNVMYPPVTSSDADTAIREVNRRFRIANPVVA